MFTKKTVSTKRLYKTWMLLCRNQDIEEMLEDGRLKNLGVGGSYLHKGRCETGLFEFYKNIGEKTDKG